MTTTRQDQASSQTLLLIMPVLFMFNFVGNAMSAQASLDRTAWTLLSWSESNALLTPLDNTTMTVHFKDNAVWGSSGCNQYLGSYETEGEHLIIAIHGGSRMLCANDIMHQESRYLAALGAAKSYNISNAGQFQIVYTTDETSGLMTFAKASSISP